jgi:hypothetical protein
MRKVNRKALRTLTAIALLGVLGSVTFTVTQSAPVKAGGFPPLTGTAANLPPAKAALLQEQVAQAANAPRADKSNTPPVADQPGTAPTGGIQNDPQGPFPYAVFAVQNSWGGVVGGQWIWIYAGQSGPENQAAGPYGGLALFSQALSGLGNGTGVTSLGFVTIPGLTGPLHIMSISGNNMALNDAQGNAYSFNLISLSFGSG